jgi:hypothetical protein
MSELTINLEKLKKIAVVWKNKHAAIESIRLVHATHYSSDHNYYKAILIAIVPKPDDDYLDWAKDPGASHIRDEVEQFGLEDVMWLTCKDMVEAKEWVVDLTKSQTIYDSGKGLSSRLISKPSITSAKGAKSKTIYDSKKKGDNETGLKPRYVHTPSITSAEGADIIWFNITEIPDIDKAGREAVSSEKKRSRSSEDRQLSITLAKQFTDKHQTKKKPYTLHEAATDIHPRLIKEWSLRTIKRWIKLQFSDEAKQPGRPKKKK